MKPVSDLYDTHPGADIYVVGTGTSMRVFAESFLADRITIGLNLAWQVAPIRYGLTIAPHCHVPEFIEGEESRPEITWITKPQKAQAVLSPEHFAQADERFYGFDSTGRKNTAPLEEPTNSGRVLDWVRQPTGVKLYQWSSISQTAVNLAANMGAKNVILVGCDNCALLDNHHAQEHHTKWLGADPQHRYRQYYEGLAEVRTGLRERGVSVLSLSPFLKLDRPDEDFVSLCRELALPTYVPDGADISEIDHPRRFLEGRGHTRSIRSRVKAGMGRARSLARRTAGRGQGRS